MIVLVGCGKAKKDCAAPASELYTSTYFKLKWQNAERLGDPYVISAKHGLLEPDEVIEPYDKRGLDDATAMRIEIELPADEEIMILAGQDYVVPLLKYLDEDNVILPFKETAGMMEQMSLLSDGL